MNNWTTAITIILTAGAMLATLRYWRIGQLPLSKKIALTVLRAAWIIGLILSFIEPTIKFERFVSGRMKIPVLIDASVSMQNFSPQTSVLPFLDSLAALQSRTDGRVSFVYFLFGADVRPFVAGNSDVRPSVAGNSLTQTPVQVMDDGGQRGLLFNDNKSIFPAALDDGGERFSSDMIIITDGHWTRARASSDVFPRNTIHYLALPDATPNPFVTLSHDAPETAPVDSPFTVSVTASGFVREASALTISLKEKDRAVKTETVNVEQGYFTRSAKFRVNNSRPGRKLYTVEATIDTSIPLSVSSFVHQTVPHFLTYSMYSSKPTLDRRYLSQALMSDEFFKARSSSPDILFLFDWDSTAAKMTRGLPKHSIPVFVGCLPCGASGIPSPSITVKQIDNTVMNAALDLRSMPPPQEILTCGQMPVVNIKRMLTASVNMPANAGGTGSAEILFAGRFGGSRQALFCPMRGVWRWDFWPMSTDRTENELFGFSNTIISAARELLLDNISDQLIIYPAATLYETDSARFLMSLPAAVPIFEPIKLSLQIKGGGVSIDTAMTYHPNGLNRQPLSLPILPQGSYSISSALTGQGVRAAFADSFTVNKDMSELSVLAQNTQYLQEFAQPLDPRDPPSLNGTFDAWAKRSYERSTVTETIGINRSWLLLGLVLTLLAIELILRRRWTMD